jgi:hypothetical protein
VFAIDPQDGTSAALSQVSYVAFVSQARNRASGALGYVHWLTYTEDPAGVPGKYRDGRLAEITRSQTVMIGERTRMRSSCRIGSEGGGSDTAGSARGATR